MMLLTWVGRSKKSMKALKVRLGSPARGLLEEGAEASQVLNCCDWWDPRTVWRATFIHRLWCPGGWKSCHNYLIKHVFFSSHPNSQNMTCWEEGEVLIQNPCFPPYRWPRGHHSTTRSLHLVIHKLGHRNTYFKVLWKCQIKNWARGPLSFPPSRVSVGQGLVSTGLRP